MQVKNSPNAKTILSKLKTFLKVRTDIELSNILEVQPSTISTWKKRDSLDYSLIISVCKQYNINLNHLFFETEHSLLAAHNQTPLVTRETLYEYTIGEIEDLADLPQYSLPFTRNRETMIFQVHSNNMSPTVEENSFVICEKIEIAEIKDNALIAIKSSKKGFFINRIEKIDDTSFLLYNDNPILKNEWVKLEKDFIDQAWKIIGFFKFNMNTLHDPMLLESRIKRIEKALNETKPPL